MKIIPVLAAVLMMASYMFAIHSSFVFPVGIAMGAAVLFAVCWIVYSVINHGNPLKKADKAWGVCVIVLLSTLLRAFMSEPTAELISMLYFAIAIVWMLFASVAISSK